MSREVLTEQRELVIPQSSGNVLEIGFGTGRNLTLYPPTVSRLVAVEPNQKLSKRAERCRADLRLPLEILPVDAGATLPIQDNTFDTVVSTWTLCSIENVSKALQEIHRVLKPGGKFLFIEHGLAPEPSVVRWQNRLNGIERAIAGGCNLNRNIEELVLSSPLSLQQCECYYLTRTPKILGYTYRGCAMKRR